MTDFRITSEQLEEVIGFLDTRQTLRAKSILKNLEVIEFKEDESSNLS